MVLKHNIIAVSHKGAYIRSNITCATHYAWTSVHSWIFLYLPLNQLKAVSFILGLLQASNVVNYRLVVNACVLGYSFTKDVCH